MGASSAETPGQAEIVQEMGMNSAAPHAGAASAKSPSEAVAPNRAAGERMAPRKGMGQGGAAQKRPRRRRQAKDGEEQQQAKKKRSVDSLVASQAVPTELSCPRLSQQDMSPVALQCHQVARCTARA